MRPGYVPRPCGLRHLPAGSAADRYRARQNDPNLTGNGTDLRFGPICAANLSMRWIPVRPHLNELPLRVLPAAAAEGPGGSTVSARA